MLRSLSLVLFLLQLFKHGAKMPKKPCSIRLLGRFDFIQSENRKNNRKTFEGASVEPTICFFDSTCHSLDFPVVIQVVQCSSGAYSIIYGINPIVSFLALLVS